MKILKKKNHIGSKNNSETNKHKKLITRAENNSNTIVSTKRCFKYQNGPLKRQDGALNPQKGALDQIYIKPILFTALSGHVW